MPFRTRYPDAALTRPCTGGPDFRDEDVAPLPVGAARVNRHWCQAFHIPDRPGGRRPQRVMNAVDDT